MIKCSIKDSCLVFVLQALSITIMHAVANNFFVKLKAHYRLQMNCKFLNSSYDANLTSMLAIHYVVAIHIATPETS